jgi:hypothetical protein
VYYDVQTALIHLELQMERLMKMRACIARVIFPNTHIWPEPSASADDAIESTLALSLEVGSAILLSPPVSHIIIAALYLIHFCRRSGIKREATVKIYAGDWDAISAAEVRFGPVFEQKF